MAVAAEDEAAIPKTLGLIGVGTIGSAVVRGLLSLSGPARTKFVISPRNAAKAAALAAEFPELVRVAASNQEVVDSVECVMVAVLPKQAEDVLRDLKFREGQLVLSLVPTVILARLRELIAPARDCAVGVPLPAVARRQGATLLIPPLPFAKAIFNSLGTCIAVEDEAQFKRLQCVTALMGDFYKRQLTTQQWLESHNVASSQAAAWVGAIFATMAADCAAPGPSTFASLVAEQTPGGLNEMIWRGQEEDGAYEALGHSLNSAHLRFTTGTVDPELAPAAKRSRKNGAA